MSVLIRTLANVRSRIRKRCDQENSTFVADADIDEMINQSYADLCDHVYDATGTKMFLASVDDVTIVGQDIYTPDDNQIYRVAGVDVQFNGKWRELEKWPFTRRNAFVDSVGWSGPHDTYYRIHNHETSTGQLALRFFPTPSAAFNFRLWYIPISPEVGTNIVALNGWDEFIVCDVCAMILEKEEGEEGPFTRRRDRALNRIVWAATNLDDSGVDEGIREVIDWGTGGSRLTSEENSEYS